jgi:beta-lactamase class D
MDIKKSNLDDFWLKGGSRITPLQQLDFIRQLAAGTLLFSEHSQTVVRKMMLIDSTSTYQLRGKTGLSYQDGKSIGWLVGYLEKGDNIIAFVLNIEMEGDASPEFMRMRGEMVHEIFLSSGIISD